MRPACLAAHGPDDGPPVQLGEHQVEHDEGRRVGLDRVEGGRPVRCSHDPEAVAFEIGPHEPDDLGVVVDDEDRGRRDRRIRDRGRHRQHGRSGCYVSGMSIR